MDHNFILIIRAIQNEEERQEHTTIKRELRDHSDPLSLPEGIFRQIYRLSRATALYIIQEISLFLQPHEREEICIPDTLIVLCALHFYSQGSYQKSVGQDMNMPMCQASVSKAIDAVTRVLNDHSGHFIKFPVSEQEKNAEKRKFMEMANGFPGIIGAIDCTHVKIVAPKVDDPMYPGILFYNRKGYYSINVQCIVGANLKILALNARYPGSVHDSAVWTTSQIRRHLLEEYRTGHRNSWLIGDGGYPLEPWLLTPISGHNLNDREQSFNIAHRSTRNVVERFNGVFKAIFRCCFADRTLHYAPGKASKIINACGIIYNIRHNRRDFQGDEEYIQIQNEDRPNLHLHDGDHEWRNEGQRIRQRIVITYF